MLESSCNFAPNFRRELREIDRREGIFFARYSRRNDRDDEIRITAIMRVYCLRNLPVSEDQTRAYDYVMLSSRYIRLPGTHNGASPCSIKSYADLGATMERGRSNRHTKK